jgi:hypothetical protein
MGNSALAADKPVEKRGFAHIGTAYQDNVREFLHVVGRREWDGSLPIGKAAK